MKQRLLFKILQFCVLFLLIFINKNSESQNVVNNGASIVVKEGANVIIGGNYFNKNDGAFDGRIDLDGNIILKRNWVNFANNEVLISAGVGPVGNVIMNGTIKQFIEGTHSTLESETSEFKKNIRD